MNENNFYNCIFQHLTNADKILVLTCDAMFIRIININVANTIFCMCASRNCHN